MHAHLTEIPTSLPPAYLILFVALTVCILTLVIESIPAFLGMSRRYSRNYLWWIVGAICVLVMTAFAMRGVDETVWAVLQ